MRKLVLLMLILSATQLQAECLKKEEVPVKDVSSLEVDPHILTHSQDSCGIRGCEIIVYSKALVGCYKNSLTTMGNYVPNSLTPNSVVISVKGKKETYKFNMKKAKFEK